MSVTTVSTEFLQSRLVKCSYELHLHSSKEFDSSDDLETLIDLTGRSDALAKSLYKMSGRSWSLRSKVIVTSGVVLIIGLVAWLLDGMFPAETKAMLFVPAVFLCARLQGVCSGLFAAALSGFANNFFVIPPVGTLSLPTSSETFALGVFVIGAILADDTLVLLRRFVRRVF